MEFGLTSSQKSFYSRGFAFEDKMWNHSVLAVFDTVYSFSRLNDAYNSLSFSHDSLRTRIRETADGPVAYVEEYEYKDFPCYEFSSDKEVDEWAKKTVNEPLSLYGSLINCALFRTPSNSGIFIWAHHIVVDGYSSFVMADYINNHLKDENFTPSEIQRYHEYIGSEEKHKNSRRFSMDRVFWKKQFENTGKLTFLSDSANASDFSSDEQNAEIDRDLFCRIREFCRNNELSAGSFFNSVYASYIYRTYGTDQFSIGVPVLNRTTAAEMNTIGLYMHLVPLIVNINPDSFFENAKMIEDFQMNLFRHQKFTQYDIKQLLAEQNKSVGSLFDIVADFQEFPQNEDFKLRFHYCNTLSVPLELHLQGFTDDCHRLKIRYRKSMFTAKDIRIMLDSLLAIAEDAVSEPCKKLSNLNMVTQKDIEMLGSFNETAHGYSIPEKSTLYSLFEKTARENTEKICLKTAERKMTFGEILSVSENLDNKIRKITDNTKSVIAVIAERSAEMYCAVYGIIRGGNAYLPIDPTYPADRIEYILKNSNAAAVVCQGKFKHLSCGLPCIDMTEFIENSEKTENIQPCIADENDTAYVIYTSGSTGNPKGAKVSHKSAVNRIMWMHDKYPLKKDDVILQKTPYTFDVSVWELFWWGMVGGSLAASRPDEHFIPEKILCETEKNKVTHIHFVPSVFELFLNYIETHKDEINKFDSVKYVFLSGEALSASLVHRFYKLYDYEKVTLHNLYGPTECAVDVTYYDCKPDDTDPVPIGKPIYNTRMHVVDKYMNLVPVGVQGELCIAGVNVGQGYLNNETLTNEKFIDNPFGDGKLYRTGDLAYWREDGEIIFCGRNDFQVKIHGQRIELGEIENAVSEIDGINLTVAVVREDRQKRQFICVFYSGTEVDSKEIKAQISDKLPKYMIPNVFVYLEEMPLTSSGKINRKALPEVDFENIETSTEYIAPETEREKVLSECISVVLGNEKVSMLDNFFDIGGDSLKAIELSAKLESKGYEIAVRNIFESKNFRELSAKLNKIETEYVKTEYGNVIPATNAQMRVYTSQYMKPDSAHYNIPYAFRVESIDKIRLEKAVNELVARHESLRTHFENRNGKILQIIDETVSVSVTALENDDISAFNTPFDLNKAPLLRVGYFENTIFIITHHIISDGETMNILLKELNALYMGRKLPETVQYGEFAVTDGYTEENENYWLGVFSEEPETINLKTDFVRPEKKTFEGSEIYELIDTHNKIENFCKKQNITPYVYYMACYSMLLSKFSCSEDIITAMPVSGRTSRFVDSVGMFVNTVALRTNPDGNKTIKEFINEVKETSINAIDNQNYPIGELIKKLNVNISSHNPFTDIMFAYQSEDATDIIFGDKKAEILPVALAGVKCDLDFTIMPRENDAVLLAEYSTDLFKESTVREFIASYKMILDAALDETAKIRDISVCDKQILDGFNKTDYLYSIPAESTLYSLFEKSARDNENKICLKTAEREMTFGEILSVSENLDAEIRRITDSRKSVIAIIAERSAEMYCAVYGIIRGGNAYLPIDPTYPSDRIEYILKNSNAAAVVCQGKFKHLSCGLPCIDMTEFIENSEKTENIQPCIADENDTAYVIYTSGSTGNPKGAKVSHKSAVNRIMWMHDKYPLGSDDVILQKTPYTFDVSVWELFWWGMVGGSLAASKPDEHFIPEKILCETEKNKVTHIHFVPSVFELFLNYLETHKDEINKFDSVKYVFLSGEALSASLVHRFYKLYDYEKVTLHNLYGPTECAVDVTYYDCKPDDTDPVPIGKPIYNTRMHVVDKYMNLVPVGVQGELCIAGVNVGQGYLNNETLTNEKFIDNPFGDGKLYRTGDLAYWREDGEIIFCGRNDFQVKIHGQRIELGEIENAVSEIDGINLTVAVVREDNKGRQFICVFYAGEEKSVKEIKEKISDKLPKYMVPNVFMYLSEMPLTSSGKINRKALPEVDLENTETTTEYISPETAREKVLSECISVVLGNEKVSMLDNFFDIGGDSLKAIELSAKLESKGYEIAVRNIFESKNFRELAEKLNKIETEYVKTEYGNVIPATHAQMRVYTSQYMKPDSAHYNIPYAFRVESFDKIRLEKAVNELISRHESLRTHFENRNGKILQIIEDNVSINAQNLSSDDISAFNTPFDLNKAPLLRVGYFENTIFIITHHIISDGETMNILLKELNELYMGRELPETVQYGEFAVTDGYTEENENYWLGVFSEESETINLKTDFVRPEKKAFEGSEIYELIETHNKIENFCKKQNITPYVYYMACYSILLSKFSCSEDIITAMPVSGRTSRFVDSVGMFVNTVALRTNPDGNKTVKDFLTEVKETSINAIDNQNYPIGELIKKLNVNISSQNPFTDIMFAYQSEDATDIIFGDKKAEILPVALAGVKCDLDFTIMPRENDAVLLAEYSTDLFKESTVKEFIASYKMILDAALDEEKCIKDISVLSENEKQRILVEFNNTAVEYDEDTCVFELFEQHAKKNPERRAIIFKDIQFSYGELLDLAEDYAGKLASLGIKAGDTVAIHLERSHRLVVLQLAVLKIGAVFLPVDKRYPEERISHACNDCNVKLLITDENVNVNTEVISIDDFEKLHPQKAQTVINKDSCYIIYTSGSTGTPKGCLLTGKGLLNFCKNNNTLETLELIDNCVFACVNAVSFDYFIAESLLPLTNGFTTVIFDDAESTIQHRFTAVANKNGVNVLMTTPTRLKIYFDDKGDTDALGKLKCICTSGEPLTAELLSQMYEKSPDAKVYNPIGPSECSVWDMGGELNREDGIDIHIGKPVANAKIFITDKYMNPVPVGVTGEICIAGDGVGNGYINNPVLTAEKFIDNPFGDGKLYKTGDLGYWRNNGNIVFVGRNDFQVKIRGLRIELGEIENAVSETDGINLTVAVVREDENGRQFICVFYTGKETEPKEIRRIISEKLPSYMIPNVFIHLDEMPLTSSGKINRKALPEDVNFSDSAVIEPPENDTEKFVCEVFSRILGVDEIGRNTDFFATGGTSLLMISMLSEKAFEDITAAEFMANSTPSALSVIMNSKNRTRPLYLEPLYVSEKSEKALILTPYGGGGAEAFSKFVHEFRKTNDDVSVYFIRFLHSDDDCEKAALEIERELAGCEVSFLSHCAGSAVTLKIIEKLEKDGFEIKNYYAAAIIPPETRENKNKWSIVPDFVLSGMLDKSGAKLKDVSKETRKRILMRFRKDTDYSTSVFCGFENKIKTPVTVIISKDDYFTRNYNDAFMCWSNYAENVKDVLFIDSESHYFQSENADELVKLIKI